MTLRHFGIALLAAAALLPLAGSCTKIELAEADSRVALDYNVALEQPYRLEQPQSKSAASQAAPLTKAATAYSTSDTFKSYAWYLPAGQNWTANKADAAAYFSDVTVEFQTDKWRGADKRYYWPKEGSLSFWSYSPASIPGASSTSGVSVTKDGVTLNGWTVDASTHQNIDFMVADFKSDLKTNVQTYGYLGVPTLFRHKLAKVTVKASTASARTTTNDIKLYKVSLKNVYTTGNFTLTQTTQDTKATESWSGLGNLQEIVVFENTAGLELDLTAQNVTLNGNDLLAIPQVLNADATRGTDNPVILCLEYSINSTTLSTAEKKLPDIKSQLWGIGQHITYSVVFGEENEPIEFSGSVSGWGTGNSTDVNIGTE